MGLMSVGGGGGNSAIKSLYTFFTSDKYGVFFVSTTAGDAITLSNVGVDYVKLNDGPAVLMPILLNSNYGCWAVLGLSENAVAGTTGSKIYDYQVSYKGKTIYIKYARTTGAEFGRLFVFKLNGVSRHVEVDASYRNAGDLTDFWDKSDAYEIYDMVLAILNGAE